MQKPLQYFYLLFFLIFISNTASFAQRSASVWTFGQNAGLNFATGTGSPVPFHNPNINTPEGCATLSDEKGNLFMYTDGVTVWNKNHQIMQNGTGLKGAQSSSQAAVIVPHPGNPMQFYIFTVEDHLVGNNSLNYSVIDMNQNNGLGAVLTSNKNTFLASPCAEKVTAIPHENKRDYWIVSHRLNSNQFIAYLLSPTGLSSVPVTSSVGQTHTNMLGYMKASHHGYKIAVAVTFNHPGVETFNFNRSTGEVSSPKVYNLSGAYGLEFSPKDHFLYVSTTWGVNTLYQIDEAANTISTIISKPGGNYIFGALQLGPDGKIYVARNERNFLDAITLPNVRGSAVGYRENYVTLTPGSTSKLGLPNFAIAPLVDFTYTFDCATNSYTFQPNISFEYDQFHWKMEGDLIQNDVSYTHEFKADGQYQVALNVYKDGQEYIMSKTLTVIRSPRVDLGKDTVICENNASLVLAPEILPGSTLRWSTGSTSPSITVTSVGTYWLEVTRGQCTVRDEINVVLAPSLPFSLGRDTTLCAGASLLLSPLLPSGSSIKWSTGSTAPTLLVTAPGTYWAEVTRGACTTRDEITISYSPPFTINLGADITRCANQPVTLAPTIPANTSIKWSDGSTGTTLQVHTSGVYWIEATNSNGCKVRDEITITLNPVPQVELGTRREICAGESLLLDATGLDLTYRWPDGSTAPTFTVTKTGRYGVTVTNSWGCSNTDSVDVLVKPLPLVNLGPDRSLCQGEPLTLGQALAGATYLWQDGSTTATFSPKTSGTYWQEVTLNGCSARDEVTITFNPLPVAALGRDTTLCVGQSLALDVTRPEATYLWQDGSTRSSININQPGTYWVEVTNRYNCTTRDEIEVYFLTPPAIELGRDTTLCYGESLIIGKVLPGVTYQWQDGSKEATYTVTQPGTYSVTASLEHCGESDAIQVKFKDCQDGLFIPNIFTPNADGINDSFFIHGLLPKDRWELTIYNRWGKQVLFTADYKNNWSGEDMSAGTYYYNLVNREQSRIFKGWVEIVK
ncbi:gliding motility-associated C-terminal domain-containing protein [Rufibacter quisquiliarum]|uniref:Gliding motility-associated-like protein n=1 Tax=Rufibacter quisquiliarum TaxID=1549639 RepID=A0A839H0K6_9BACT|nr:gliding motility-associated C-terminal domain-containing protein [Rufibacter quisquiliarum]MBA9079451.1 gliding motility-associated-like protein [Rufibacter quisquiliarum]